MLVLCAAVRPAGQRTMAFIKIDYGKGKGRAVDATGGMQHDCTSAASLFHWQKLQLGASFNRNTQ